jgi:hypothetical protein
VILRPATQEGTDGGRGTGPLPSFASLAQGRSAFLISMPLLGPLPRHVLLPLVRLLVAVWPLAKLLKLSSGLGVANGLERLFEGFPGPLGAGSRLPSQDLVGHLAHSLLLFHGLLLPGGSPPCGGNGTNDTILPCPLER